MEKLTNLEGIYNSETEKLRSDLERLQLSEEEAKIATGRVLSLQEEIAKLRKDLEQTQSDKKSIEERADRYKQETEQVGASFHISIYSFHRGNVLSSWAGPCGSRLVSTEGKIQMLVCLLFIISVFQACLPHDRWVVVGLLVEPFDSSKNTGKVVLKEENEWLSTYPTLFFFKYIGLDEA